MQNETNNERDQEQLTQITEHFRKAGELTAKAEMTLDPQLCEQVRELLNKLRADLRECRAQEITVPGLSTLEVHRLTQRIEALKKTIGAKDALHQSISGTDEELYRLTRQTLVNAEVCETADALCRKQMAQFRECHEQGWPLPDKLRVDPGQTAERFRLCQTMLHTDAALCAASEEPFSKERNARMIGLCEQQLHAIESCRSHDWALPELKLPDPAALKANAEQEIQKQTKKRSRLIGGLMAGAAVAVIGGAAALGVNYYEKTHVRIPFDAAAAQGQSVSVIWDELEKAGFTVIYKEVDDSGWQAGGEVLRVSIDGAEEFQAGTLLKPDVRVVVTCTSSQRLYVTDLLAGWQERPYTEIREMLEEKGFTNIAAEEVVTSDRKLHHLASSLTLNGQDYTNEPCYLPVNAPVVISYYALKIRIGSDQAALAGQPYRDVIDALEESGFANVTAEAVSSGWVRGGDVLSVTVDGSDSFAAEDSFDPDVPIIVRYSSDDRLDAAACLSGWENADYEELLAVLGDAGFENVRGDSTVTEDPGLNRQIESVTVDGTAYTGGDCYIQRDLPIVVRYYHLMPRVGFSAPECRNMPYEEIVEVLRDKGFSNIELRRADDLNFLNLLTYREGTVKSITIGGSSQFLSDSVYDYDVPIVIVVHTYKGRGCEEITATEN